MITTTTTAKTTTITTTTTTTTRHYMFLEYVATIFFFTDRRMDSNGIVKEETPEGSGADSRSYQSPPFASFTACVSPISC